MAIELATVDELAEAIWIEKKWKTFFNFGLSCASLTLDRKM
ncbi:hypothetical protein [Cyclobacterium marinum]